MNILIATGIYPPEIGGPAQYAKNLADVWRGEGYDVNIKVFSRFNSFPTGIRHLFYFFSIFGPMSKSDFVLALDTFSAALPAVLACKLLRKKIIIRTGGDFLWESYVERTGKKVLLRNFYKEEISNLSQKERKIFNLTRWILNKSSKVVFSTEWQRDIFLSAYNLDIRNTNVIENYYGPKELSETPNEKVFVASSRNLVWKNLDILKSVFAEINSANLFSGNIPFPEFMKRIQDCYAVILVSLGDISPNMILDAIRYNKPFICTKEVGIFDRIKGVGIFVDPLDKDEIKKAILDLLEKENYEKAVEKVRSFSFVHTWGEIGNEFLKVNDSLK